MSYVVLARKWRPMRFEDLVGQDHVSRTLGNAIDSGRVAHAFLFTGVRGVGKTTSARILAKALNCMREPGSVEEGAPDPGPTVTPCLKCPACIEITDGRDVDVQEIDGASYNGVDEVRKLQDSLPYRPSRDRYKIVIVDEVHMLTQAAWNAFLKTLEEPPPHVKFIFATTEVHKVPITILSRIQRFDFKMIPTRLIVDRLRWVLEQEDSSADEVALGILARQAAGSMRDAMSLLDQVIAFSGKELSGDDVARVLGVASRGALIEIARAIVSGDGESCLRRVGALADQGFDIPHVAQDLLALIRDLVVAKVCQKPEDLMDLADQERSDVIEIAAGTNQNDLLRLHQAFSRGYDDVVRSGDPRAGLEMLLVRLAQRPPLLPIDELLHRIGNLEKRLTQAGAGRSRGNGGSHGASGMPDGRPPNQRARQRTPSDASPPATPAPAKNDDDDVPDVSPTSLASNSPKKTSPSPPTLEPAPSQAVTPAAREEKFSLSDLKAPPSEALARFEKLAEITEKVREESIELSAYLEQTVPLQADGKVLEVGLEKGHLFEPQLTQADALALVDRVLKSLWGQNAEFILTRSCADARPERTLSAERTRKRKVEYHQAVQSVKNHPRVREALQLFGAQIKSVSVPDRN